MVHKLTIKPGKYSSKNKKSHDWVPKLGKSTADQSETYRSAY
jgi:hypothetical protein